MKQYFVMTKYKRRPVQIINNGWTLLLICCLFVYSGVLLWALFSEQIKAVLRWWL